MNSTISSIMPRRELSTAQRAGLVAVASEIDPATSPTGPVDLDEAAREKDLGMLPMPDPVETYAPTKTQLPAYVEHAPNTPRTGMLSAEAIVMEFEQTAQEIEKLGDELRSAAKRAEEAQATLAKALADLTGTAKAYREEAARVFAHVETVTAKASDASALCAQLREKIASGA